MDKLVVTGNAGFIGQNFCDMFDKKYKLVRFERGDSPPDEIACENTKAVVHLGGISSTEFENTEEIMMWNYDYTVELRKTCLRTSTPMIFASSASVYGNSTTFTEFENPDPKSRYAWTKYLAERELIKMQSSRAPVHCLRFFNVYGPFETHKKEQASVMHKFPIEAKSTGKIKVFEGSEHIKRDFIHVDDVCRIVEKFIEYPYGGIYNVGTGEAYSFYDVAKVVATKYEVPIEEVPVPDNLKGHYQSYTKSDNSLLSQVIGQYDFINVLEWMNKHA